MCTGNGGSVAFSICVVSRSQSGVLDAMDGGRWLWHHGLAGAVESVRRLHSRGIRVAVVSNSDGTVAEEFVTAGFDGMFETVVDSHLVGVSKPDPRIFAIALERLEVPASSTWYVGDSPHHDMAALPPPGWRGSTWWTRSGSTNPELETLWVATNPGFERSHSNAPSPQNQSGQPRVRAVAQQRPEPTEPVRPTQGSSGHTATPRAHRTSKANPASEWWGAWPTCSM